VLTLFITATDFLFGKSTEVLGTGLSRQTGEKFGKTFEYVTASLGRAARLGKLAALFPDPEFKHGLKFIHEFIQVYVRKALEQRTSLEKAQQVSSKYVFLEKLAMTGCSAKKIQDELLNVLLAGRDTTAGCLSHLWYTIAHRPDVFEKLRAEVQRLEGAAPSFEQLKEMKYL
jgi:cytochrome P450